MCWPEKGPGPGTCSRSHQQQGQVENTNMSVILGLRGFSYTVDLRKNDGSFERMYLAVDKGGGSEAETVLGQVHSPFATLGLAVGSNPESSCVSKILWHLRFSHSLQIKAENSYLEVDSKFQHIFRNVNSLLFMPTEGNWLTSLVSLPYSLAHYN